MEYFSLDQDPIVGGKSDTQKNDINRQSNEWRLKWRKQRDPKVKSRHQLYRESKKDNQ